MCANHPTTPRPAKLSSIGGAVAALVQLCGVIAGAGEKVELSACPKAVRQTVRAEAALGRVVDVEPLKIEGKAVFEVDYVLDDREYELHVRQDGVLLHKILDDDNEADESQGVRDEDSDGDDAEEGNSDEKEGDQKEGDEQGSDDEGDDDGEDEEESGTSKVGWRLADLPKSVAKTLKRESRGGEIEEIEREIEDGRITYEAEVEFKDGDDERVYEIEIDERGVLLSKALTSDEEDEEDDD